jgi:hypothetical protein
VRDPDKAKRSERDDNRERCPGKIIEAFPRFDGPCRSSIRASTYSVKEGKIAGGVQKTPLLLDLGTGCLLAPGDAIETMITARDKSFIPIEPMLGVLWC